MRTPGTDPPLRQVRAVHDDVVRVYQAYSDEIADATLAAGTFASPPFKMSRAWVPEVSPGRRATFQRIGLLPDFGPSALSFWPGRVGWLG